MKYNFTDKENSETTEPDLGSVLFITSNSSHFFNKTDLERYLFKYLNPLVEFSTVERIEILFLESDI